MMLVSSIKYSSAQEGVEAASPFYAFVHFSDWLWQATGKTSSLTSEAAIEAGRQNRQEAEKPVNHRCSCYRAQS